MTLDIICADAREALARFPDGHFHCCVSSPPFWGLRDYGLEPTVWGGDGCEHEWLIETRQPQHSDDGATGSGLEGGKGTQMQSQRSPTTSAFCRRCNAWRGTLGLEPTPELYVEHLVGVMREVRRVLRDDGTLWLNLGDSYAAGGRGSPFSEASAKQATNAGSYDGAILRGGPPPGLKPKDLVGVPWMVAFALRADGWWLRRDIIWSKPNPMPESVTDRPTSAHEYLFLLTKAERYYYDADAIRQPHTDESAKRYLRNSSYDGDGDKPYAMKQGPRGHGMPKQDALGKRTYTGFNERWEQAQRQKWDKDGSPTWVKGHSGYINADGHVMVNAAGRNRRSVWEIATQPFPGAHFAVFPEKLVEPCILAGTSEWGCCPECGAPWERVVEREVGDQRASAPDPRYREESGDHSRSRHPSVFLDQALSTTRTTTGWRPTCKHGAEPVPCRVLDPFAGSGTVGLVAERLGRHSVLIDAKEEYCEMAQHRTAQRGLMVGETP